MRKIFLLLALVIPAMMANAQKFNIKGKLHDAQGGELPYATVLLLNAKDSTMTGYALSGNNGDFEIKDVNRSQYNLKITYIGYFAQTIAIAPPSGNVLDLGVIRMQEESTLLREVTIREERIPMRVKNDTIEYDALAFRPLANEKVEDLIKRMPGIEVGTDGSITAQGEQVRRVLVDGKEFFGRDPKMATQNLPADAIAKVHVFDQRSERSQFTGIDDGQRERTMNLELKEDRKQGAFGNTSLGYGPTDFFNGRTNLNRFNSKGQVSLLAMGNNLNQQGFSIAEYMNFSGGTQNLMAGNMQFGNFNSSGVPINFSGLASNNGIMTSWAGGVNLNRKFTPKTELTASYFYNQLDHDIKQDLQRENFLPSGNFNYDQISSQDNQNYNHRLNLRLDHKMTERSSILLTSNAGFNQTKTLFESNSRTLNADGILQNSGEQVSRSEGQTLNMDMSLLYRQRLTKPGRTLTAGMDFSVNDNNREGDQQAINRFFGNQPGENLINQENTQDNYTRSISSNLTYTEPLSSKRFLEFNYRITQNRNEIDQQVFDVNGQDRISNEQLTNQYTNDYLYQRGGLNLLLNGERYNLTLGSSVQASSLEGRIQSLQEPITKEYLNVLPVVRYNYQFNTFRRLSVNYETSVQEPTVLQLQPLVDTRDPLNLYVGNPNLRPSYRHRTTLRFNSFNPMTSFGYFAFLTADINNNAITNALSVDEQLVRTVTPVNVDQNTSLRANFNVNFAARKIKSRFSVGSSVNRSQSTSILNQVSQKIVNNTLSGNFRYNFLPIDNWETNLTANVSSQLTEYQFSSTEQAFLNQTYGVETNWSFLKHYRLSGNYRYQIYEGRTSDFDRKIPMLELHFSRSFLKNNAGELKFSGYNLLDKDLGVTQTSDVNYLERRVTNSLGRYFLLTFTYSLNRSLNVLDGAGPGRGRGMMIMH